MAQGFFAGGNGTKESPFLIEDADDLNAIRNNLSAHYKMINDINLSEGKYNLNQGWQPIRNFTGTLNGANHKIINLYVNRPTEDYVGFFKILQNATINNIGFVNPIVKGHSGCGILTGGFINTKWEVNSLINNIFVEEGFVSGDSKVSGVCGWMIATAPSTISFTNIFVDVEIQSKEGIAYGVGFVDVGRVLYRGTRSYSAFDNGVYRYDCNCNCSNGDCNCNCSYTNNNTFANCISKLRKNELITTYYSFSNNAYVTFENCYADNSEIQPVIYTGITYKNITDIQHEINLLPNVDSNYFTKKVNAMLEPKFLNNDAIYLQFNNGYHVYDFTNNEFVQKYTKFSNENSKEIIQNGMDKVSFSKIPNSKLKEIQDKYGKVKVVNCINAHKKIVYKTNTLEMNYDKQKSVYRKKVEFNKFNEVTSIKKK